jgi:transposase
MVAPRRVIALPSDARQRQRLLEISRSRTEPTGRVERARIILAYLDDPSAYAVARAIGVTQQTVTRCLERAAELGVIEALDDRPRAGRDPVMTAEAKTWLVALACRKAKELGYPHELWTTRLLAAHARQHGPTAGHPSLAKLAQGTVCKILAEHEVKPHKVRYYLEKRDPEFEPKMAKSSVSTGKWRCCVGKRRVGRARAKTAAGASPSSRMTRNPGSRRSPQPRRIAHPCLAKARR